MLASSMIAKGTIEQSTIDQAAGAISALIIIGFSIRAKIIAARKLSEAASATKVIIDQNNSATTTPPTSSPNVVPEQFKNP
jgi:hypothetical protein